MYQKVKYIFLPNTAIWQKDRNDKLAQEIMDQVNIKLEKYKVPNSIIDIYRIINNAKHNFKSSESFYLIIDKKIDGFLILLGFFFSLYFNAEIIYLQHSDFQFGAWDFTWKIGWFKRNWKFKIREKLAKTFRSLILLIILFDI